MRGAVPQQFYRLDKNGYLAAVAAADEPVRVAAHAKVLWDTKLTRNDPKIVKVDTGPPPTYPTPIVSDTSPRDIVIGPGVFTLTIQGTGFIPQSQFIFEATPQLVALGTPTTLRSDTVPNKMNVGGVDVCVRQPDGQISNTKRFIFRSSV